MRGVRAVLWRELIVLRRRLVRTLASYAISPLLFLIAFGWGMGRGVRTEGVDYLSFMLPGLVALSSMSHSFGISTDLNIARFYWMTFEELQVAPVSSLGLALGEALAGTLRGLLAAGVVLLLGAIFGVGLHPGGWLPGVILLNAFLFASAGVIAALTVRSHADQAALNSLVIVPMAFLCGTFFSLQRLPDWARLAVQALPLTHTTACIRAAALGQALPLGSLLVAVAWAWVLFLGAAWQVRRTSL